MKYMLLTYGCQMNTADSEEMAQPLQDRGFTQTSDVERADVVIMNTCTVREHAEHKALSNLGRLRHWKRENPNRILIVAGCAASLWGESLKKKFPYVDLVSPATEIEQFPDAIANVLKERWNWDAENKVAFGYERESERAGERENNSFARSLAPSLPHSLFGSEATAYVTVMRGCNLNCSYCIVPQVRGREKYRPMPEILDEVRAKVAAGYREVMLLGQTVNSYYWRSPHPGCATSPDVRRVAGRLGDLSLKGEGRALPSPFREKVPDAATTLASAKDSVAEGRMRALGFSDLLRAVNEVEGVERIRFMSPHPKHMRDGVIRAMSECAKVARHVHLPVQSGSDRILERMKRLYSRKEYLSIVQKLRAAIPGIAVTTDVIVGYPSETTADFEMTLALVEDVQFNGLFAFKYSPRPGTDSAQEDDDVSDDVKEERLQEVLALSLRLKAAQAAR